MNSLESRCGSRLVHEFEHKYFTDRCPSSGRCSLKILHFYPYRNWRTHNFDLPKLFQKTAYYMMHICTCIYLYKCIQYTVYSIQYTIYSIPYTYTNTYTIHLCMYIYINIYSIYIYIEKIQAALLSVCCSWCCARLLYCWTKVPGSRPVDPRCCQ